MFETLSERLGGVFDRLTKQGALTEADVQVALREVRGALLDADVSLPVARDFTRARTRSPSPGGRRRRRRSAATTSTSSTPRGGSTSTRR